MRKQIVLFALLSLAFIPPAHALSVSYIPMALSPQAVAVDAARNRLFVVQDDSFGMPGFEVAVVDTNTNSVVTRIPISGNVFTSYGIAVDETAGRVYVANGFGLVVIDAASLAVLSTISPPFATTTVVVNAATHRIYANFSFTGFAAIDTISQSVVGTTFLSSIPRDLELDAATNRIFATHESAGFVSVIDGASLAVTTVPISGRLLAAGSDAALGRLYVADDTLTASGTASVLDTSTLASLGTLAIGGRCEGIAADPVTHRVYSGSGSIPSGVTISDGSTLAPIAFVPTSHLAARAVAVNTSTHRVYIATGETEPSGAVIVIDDAPPDADVSVSAAFSPAAPVSGTAVSLTIDVANAGPATANSIVVTTTLPSQTVTSTIASLAAGASQTITIGTSVDCTAADGAQLTATVSVSAATPDPVSANNSANANATVSNPAPSMSCPADITQTLPAGASTMVITYPLPQPSTTAPARRSSARHRPDRASPPARRR